MASILILSTEGMRRCADDMAQHLQAKGVDAQHYALNEQRFSDGELWEQAPVSVRTRCVYLLADLYWPDPNNGLMRAFIALDMLKRASVQELHLVVPYLPYGRQDRKDKPRVPISSKLVADLFSAAGPIASVITFDMHADQEEACWNVPVDHLRGDLLLAQHFLQRFSDRLDDLIVIAPDAGSAKRAQRFATRLHGAPLAIIDKRRSAPGVSSVAHFVGPERLDGKLAVLLDDMCASGGTLAEAAKVLYGRGAAGVYAALTHGLFTDGAEARLAQAGIEVAVLRTISAHARLHGTAPAHYLLAYRYVSCRRHRPKLHAKR